MAIDSILSLSLVWFEEAGLIFFAFFNDHTLGVVVVVAFGLILLRVLWWWLFHPCWRTLRNDPFGLSKMTHFGRNKLTHQN